MKPEENSESQAKMPAVIVLFDQWRSTRKKRDRIPERLSQKMREACALEIE